MFYGNNPFQRPMFGGQYGALSPFGNKATEEQPPVLMENGGEPSSYLEGYEGLSTAEGIGKALAFPAEKPFTFMGAQLAALARTLGIDARVLKAILSNKHTFTGKEIHPEGTVLFTDEKDKAKTYKNILKKGAKILSPVGAFLTAMAPKPAYAEGGEVMPMQQGGAPMYADQGSQFMPAAGRPPVPASVQMANELDQIGRMKQQRESTIIQKIAEQRGVSVEEVLRLLALANAAEATPANPPTPAPAPVQEMTQTNIPYPDAPSATVMQQGGPNPSEWDMLTEGEKLRILNNLEMGNVTRPEVALPMQEGGNVGIAALPQMGAEQPSPPMPAAPMAGIDPAMVEQTLSQMEGQVPQIDDAEDYEQMMNTIRGDEQPMEARYSELAGVVGEEDAAQTPESVLALVQPVMVMASVDQGIGGLAQEEMTQPIEGEMAGGIMSMAGQPQGV